jgi:hypothetical protein
MNIRASTRDLAGIVQTIPSSDPFDELSFFHGLSPVLKKDGGGKINAG